MDDTNPPKLPAADMAEQPTESKDFAALADFRVTHPKEIGGVLRHLMNRKDFLTVARSNSPDFIITRVLNVDLEQHLFFYDWGSSQTQSHLLLQSSENCFSATQEGVRIQFVCGRPEQSVFNGLPAFRSSFPESLYRMQRRDFFRVDTPIADPYRCTAKLPTKREVRFDIADLSMNGVGLRSKDQSLGEGLQIGTVLTGATLDFRKEGTVTSDLMVTFLRSSQSTSNTVYHIGCRFLNLPRAKERDLQRLITYLELARRDGKN